MHYFSREIQILLERGDVLELVLVDGEGMVLEARGDHYPPEQLAALFSPLHRLLETIRLNMDIGGIEEISVRTLSPRMRILVQSFSVQESPFLLIALYPITTFYRQVTSDIVRIVKECIRKLAPQGPDGEVPSAPPAAGRKEP